MKFNELDIFKDWEEYSESEEELKDSVILQHSTFVKDRVAVGASEFSDKYIVTGFVNIMSQAERIVSDEVVSKEGGKIEEAIQKVVEKVLEEK